MYLPGMQVLGKKGNLLQGIKIKNPLADTTRGFRETNHLQPKFVSLCLSFAPSGEPGYMTILLFVYFTFVSFFAAFLPH
jgi:hypothetical protein